VDQLPTLAAELVAQRVDVIIAHPRRLLRPPAKRPPLFQSYSPSMPIRLASGTLQVSRNRVGTSRECRCSSQSLPPRDWR
jgi:hypothetical protein